MARPIQTPPSHSAPLVGETQVQFHNDQTHLLVVHESQIGIYDSQLECLRLVSDLSGHSIKKSVFRHTNITLRTI